MKPPGDHTFPVLRKVSRKTRLNYTFRQLRYFIAVVEQNGILNAARRLNISQPALSAAIKNLEQAFDIQLFRRHPPGGKVSLTPTGQRVYHHAVALLRSNREFERLVLAEQQVSAGSVEVACLAHLAPFYLPSLLAGFRDHFPDIHVTVVECQQQELTSGVVAGRFDVVISYADAHSRQELKYAPLLGGLVPHVLLPRSHSLAHHTSISLRRLSAEPLVLLDIAPCNAYVMQVFTELGLQPRIAYRATSTAMAMGLVGRRFGYSVTTTAPANVITEDGCELVSLPISDAVSRSTLVMAWAADYALTPQAIMFLKHCQAQFPALGNVCPLARAS